MPRPPRQIEPPGRIEPPVRRRQVLVALAVVPVGLAAACTGGAGVAPAPTGAPSTPPPADPLVAHLVAEQRFLASYQAAIARHPSLAGRLGPLRDDHAAHVAAMQRELGVPPAAPTSPAASTSTSGTPAASPTPDPAALAEVPGTPAAAIRMLRRAEHDAAVDRAAGCLIASPTAAPLLASIAACEASHEAVLT